MTRLRSIVFDCEKMRNPNTGLYYFCLQLGSALQQVVDERRERLIYYTPRSNPTPFGPGMQYRHQQFWHKFYNAASNGIDVWHGSYQLSNYWPRSRRTRMVLTIHDLNFLIDTKADEPQKVSRYLKKMQATIDRADYIVCISEYTRRMVLQNMKIDSGKPVDVIHNGCHVQEFTGYDAPVYRPQKPFLFSLGIFFPKKNFHVLPALLGGNDYELILAGERLPEYEAIVRRQAALHGVADRVKILGTISEEDKYWYYKNCSAFVFPSLAEGFGLPVVEAMAFGKPVFLSTATSLPEIGGDLAFYFDDFEPDRMKKIFEAGMSEMNPERAEQLKRRSAEFSWKTAAEAYWRTYSN